MSVPSAQTPPPEDDHRVFERLVHSHQGPIWRYLRFLGCSPSEADELTQDTFVAVVGRSLHCFGAPAARAYLRRVARNAFLKHRQNARETSTEDLDALDSAFDWFVREDDGEHVLAALRSCLERLDARGREVLKLRYTDQMDRSAIGKRLGLSAHGVKSMLHRNYARLRTCLQRRLADV